MSTRQSINDLVDNLSSLSESQIKVFESLWKRMRVYTNHILSRHNPHRVNKYQVGLGRVENHPVASETQARAGTSNQHYMTPLRSQQALDDTQQAIADAFDQATADLS